MSRWDVFLKLKLMRESIKILLKQQLAILAKFLTCFVTVFLLCSCTSTTSSSSRWGDVPYKIPSPSPSMIPPTTPSADNSNRQSDAIPLNEVTNNRVTTSKAFIGIRTRDCKNTLLGNGVFVVDFWRFKEGIETPAISAGIRIGDKIVCINSHCDKFSSDELTSYLFKVTPNTVTTVVVERLDHKMKVVKQNIQVASMIVPASCQSNNGKLTCVESTKFKCP